MRATGKRVFVFAIAVLATVLSMTDAYAGVYTCDGYVEVSLGGGGSDLYLKTFAGSSYLSLCSLTTTVNNVTADGCKSIYAMLLGAQFAKQRVRIWFNDTHTCSTQGSWTVVALYFGPELLES